MKLTRENLRSKGHGLALPDIHAHFPPGPLRDAYQEHWMQSSPVLVSHRLEAIGYRLHSDVAALLTAWDWLELAVWLSVVEGAGRPPHPGDTTAPPWLTGIVAATWTGKFRIGSSPVWISTDTLAGFVVASWWRGGYQFKSNAIDYLREAFDAYTRTPTTAETRNQFLDLAHDGWQMPPAHGHPTPVPPTSDGPEYPDGTDAEGFPGGDARMGGGVSTDYPHGSVTWQGICPSCGSHHSLTVGHPSAHTWVSGATRKTHCRANGRITCASVVVELRSLLQEHPGVDIASRVPLPVVLPLKGVPELLEQDPPASPPDPDPSSPSWGEPESERGT